MSRRGIHWSDARIEDLSAHDQLHAGLLEATRRFAKWACVPAGCRVLDVGAGLGGSARFLAQALGCRVTALELSPELHEMGLALTSRLGLADRVAHMAGSFSDADVPGAYDAVWIQHVDMQVPDKQALYAFCRSRLAPGGRIVWHDWLAGAGGPPRYPVMWSADGSLSFPATEEEMRELLGRAGLALDRLEDIGAETRGWFERSLGGIDKALSRLEPGAPRRAKLEGLREEIASILSNIEEKRLVPFFGEARAA